jgi:hypothetical protein
VTGQLLSLKVEKGNQKPDGSMWPDRYVVSLLIGDRTASVAYRTEEAALGALAGAAQMQMVALPVYVRAAKSYVFYDGRVS